MRDNTPIPPAAWGRDHFSTLLYLETRIVDVGGVVSPLKLRARASGYPTVLRDGERANHGGLDCIEDMRAAGLVEGGGRNTFAAHEVSGGPNPRKQPFAPFALTHKGWQLAHFLRRWMADNRLSLLPPVEAVCRILDGVNPELFL
jgi:hypothetical protein